MNEFDPDPITLLLRSNHFRDVEGNISPKITPVEAILVLTLVEWSIKSKKPLTQDKLIKPAEIKNPKDLLVHFFNIRKSLSSLTYDPEKYITTHDRYQGFHAAYSAHNLILDGFNVPKVESDKREIDKIRAQIDPLSRLLLNEVEKWDKCHSRVLKLLWRERTNF